MTTKQKKCSDTQKGRVVIHKGDTIKRVYPNEVQSYLDNGWVRGFTEKHNRNNSKSNKGKTSWNKGVPCSEEKKVKISNSLKGNIPWNKGLTADNDVRVKANTKKSYETKIKRYGNAFPDNNMNDEHKKKLSESHKGILKGRKLPKDKLEIKLTKEYITKKLNNSFNTSKPEEELYKKLLEENKHKTIYRNYKDERYPFYCDFYILEDDLFIELNAHWTHGGRPYNPDDVSCQQQLKEWQEKAKTSQYVANAIETWTVRDVKKQEIAKEHNLNYKVIY